MYQNRQVLRYVALCLLKPTADFNINCELLDAWGLFSVDHTQQPVCTRYFVYLLLHVRPLIKYLRPWQQLSI